MEDLGSPCKPNEPVLWSCKDTQHHAGTPATKQELAAGIACVLTAAEMERPNTINSVGIIYLQGFYLHRGIHYT